MAPHKKSLDRLKIDRPSHANRSRGGSWVVVIILLLLLGGTGFWWWQRPAALEVETTTARVVSSGGARTLLNASGYVTARRNATVSSKVTGRVTEVLIEEGMVVSHGQVLARLDDSNVRANYNLAAAQLASSRQAIGETEAALAQAERTLRRTQKLAESEVVSTADLDQALSNVEVLRARLVRQSADIAVAESQVALWQQQLDDTVIRAPFAGVVTSKNAQPGEMISPVSAGGGFTRTGICTIVDMSSLEVEVDVNETYINRVQQDQPVVSTLDSYPDWRIPSRVIAIIPTADRQKATVRVRVGFDELDARILPDMGLKVAFQSEEDTSSAPVRQVVTDTDALHRDDGRDVVWVVADGTVERRAVTIDQRNGSEVVISGGLSGGEILVIDGPDGLADGVPVTEKKS